LSKAWLSVSVPQFTVNVLLDPDVVSGSLKQISGLNITSIWSELCSGHDAVESQTDLLYTTTICDLVLNNCGSCHDSGGQLSASHRGVPRSIPGESI